MLPTMRAWLINTVAMVMVAGLGALSGCTKDNPGWTAGASGGSSTGLSTGTTTIDETNTGTTADTTTDTTTGSTTGEPIQCPLDGSYCPFFTDVAEAPDQATCDGTETYVALRSGTSFFRCAGNVDSCAADACTELVIEMPDVYGIIVNQLAECITVEHEQKWINGNCRTRALAAWADTDDPQSDPPQIMLASHDPAPPPSLTDLTITDAGERLECECTTVGCVDFIVNKDSWCCGGKLSLGSYSITNDADMTYRANYTEYLGYTPIQYRGCNYNFFVTQGHDGSPSCAGESKFQAGWFMQRLGC